MHLPVQSGSSRMLKVMRRRHSREEYLDIVSKMREAIPGVTFSTDVIVGFPGESRADFDETLSLTEAVRYHSMFSFKYSVRPNTLASKRLPDDVPDDEKTTRIVALQTLQRSIQTSLHEAAVGTTMDVLVDSASRRQEQEISGRSAGNTVVSFPVPADGGPSDAASWIGRTVPVLVTRAGPYSVWGAAVAAPPHGTKSA
jgi:tRNA-2-methylthio-N6-dimethylallyladenosine synthase